VSDGYLSAIVGSVIAGRIGDALTADANDKLRNKVPPPPVPVKWYDINLTEVGITYRFCPVHPRSSWLERAGTIEDPLAL
jgi:hypothetical protein